MRDFIFRGGTLELTKRPAVMGIINVTPDSFYAGSRKQSVDAVLQTVEQMIADGVDLLDIGGESTRPGAAAVSVDEERQRVVPVIEAICKRFSLPVSIDTRHSLVAEAALDAGAEIMNDISAFSESRMVELAAQYGVPYILMHMQGQPDTMQDNPAYGDVIAELSVFFEEKIARAIELGLAREKVWIDPGIGFGKRLQDNLAIIRELSSFGKFELPVLMGLSRKSFIAGVTGASVEDRLLESSLYHLVSLQNGASVLRVHDVAAAVRCVAVYQSLSGDAGFSA